MTSQRLMRDLYRTYLEFFLGTAPGLLGMPLPYHRFVDAVCYIVVGQIDREQEVLEHFRTYRDYCLKHSEPVDLYQFVARSIVANRQRITSYLLRQDGSGVPVLPVSVNGVSPPEHSVVPHITEGERAAKRGGGRRTSTADAGAQADVAEAARPVPLKHMRRRTAKLGPETQRQMTLVWDHAAEDWKAAALTIVISLAKQRPVLTSLDLVDELERQGYVTHDLRAIGPVMVRAAKEGVLEHGQFIRRNDRHNRGSTVEWISLIYRAEHDGLHQAV